MGNRIPGLIACASLLLFALACDSAVLNLDGKNDDRERQLRLLGLFFIAVNPCTTAVSPGTGSAGFSAGSVAGFGSVSGRLLTATGAPVVSALVTVDDGDATNSIFYSSHTSINRDGSFTVAGIPAGSGYRVSVEPVNPLYANRITTHIDCFETPASFTEGFYSGADSVITTTSGSAAGFSLSSTESRDLGTFRILE